MEHRRLVRKKELATKNNDTVWHSAHIYVTDSDGTAHRYMDFAIVERFFGDSVIAKAKTLEIGEKITSTVDNGKVNFRTKEGKDLATITSLTRLS